MLLDTHLTNGGREREINGKDQKEILMTLQQFLSALQTPNAMVSVIDLDTNAEIVNLKAQGFASLDESIIEREVKQWTIVGVTSVRVVIAQIVPPSV